MALTISVEHDLPGAQGVLEKIQSYLSDPPLANSGRDLLAGMTKRIDAGMFTPLASSTLAIRASRGRVGSKPLSETGGLRQSLVSQVIRKREVQIGTNDSRADVLRFGGMSGGFIPGKRIPPREFLEITQSMLEGVVSDLLSGVAKL